MRIALLEAMYIVLFAKPFFIFRACNLFNEFSRVVVL